MRSDSVHYSNQEELTLLLLSDSSLPVGGFVSSSGLESFINHGFLASHRTDLARSDAILKFAFSNAHSYAHLCAAFFYHLHACVSDSLESPVSQHDQPGVAPQISPIIEEQEAQRVALVVSKLNQLFDTMCLSPVNRRNSYAQGAAFLLLYTKSFSPSHPFTPLETRKSRLITALKSHIRTENWAIHYPISFAFVTSLLQLSFDRAMYLHIFLHIRSILSAAVRLNVMGPYLSQRMMFKEMGPMMEEICRGIAGKRLARCDLIECGLSHLHLGPPPSDSSADQVENGPSSSWPFGEIIQTRHDSCHVRLFNS